MNGLTLIKVDKKKLNKYNPNNYYEFGKFIINKKLLNTNILLVKYPISFSPVPKIKRQSISDDFKVFIIDLLDNGELNIHLQKNLNNHDVKLLEDLLNLSSLKKQLNYERQYKSVQDYMDRFLILQGWINAATGSRNETIITELFDIIDLLSNKTINRISTEDAIMLKDCLI